MSSPTDDAVRRLYERVITVANESGTVEDALAAGLEAVCTATEWDVGHVFLIAGDELVATDIWHLDDPERFATFREVTAGFTLPIDVPAGPLRRTVLTAEPTWVTDVHDEEGFQRSRLAGDLGVHGAFAFPVLIGREVVAVLEFYSRERAQPERDLLHVMAHVGAQLGRVFERARVQQAERRAVEGERRYLRIAAHEFRSPLAVAAGYLDLLRDDPGLGEGDRREAIEVARRELRRLETIATNFLLESRLHAGALRPRREEVAVGKLTADAITDVHGRSDEVGNDCPAALSVLADPFLLRQCLVNLLANAEHHGEPPVVVSARPRDAHVEIVVADHGSGVPEEFIPRLFERFSRASERGRGVGLGLEIVHHLVAIHDGDVHYEANEPRGARFVISLPLG